MKILHELVNPEEYKKLGHTKLTHIIVDTLKHLESLREDFAIALATDNRKAISHVGATINVVEKNVMKMTGVVHYLVGEQIKLTKVGFIIINLVD